MQLTRDLFAIAKFLLSYAAYKQTDRQKASNVLPTPTNIVDVGKNWTSLTNYAQQLTAAGCCRGLLWISTTSRWYLIEWFPIADYTTFASPTRRRTHWTLYMHTAVFASFARVISGDAWCHQSRDQAYTSRIIASCRTVDELSQLRWKDETDCR